MVVHAVPIADGVLLRLEHTLQDEGQKREK